MTQPQAISFEQLSKYRTQLESGKMSIGEFYDSMESKGYHYASWAAGVARGDGISGVAALEYMKKTSIEGVGGEPGRKLNDADVESVRKSMAMGYLKTVETIAQKNGGTLNRDVNFQETENFHRKAFEDNHLKIDNWTLKIPMDLIKKTQGEPAVEKLWTNLRDTGGSGPAAMFQNTMLMTRVGKLMSSPDPEISRPAQAWIDRAPGTANPEALAKALGATGRGNVQYAGEVLENNAKRFANALTSGAEYVNHAIDANPTARTVKKEMGNKLDQTIKAAQHILGADSTQLDPGKTNARSLNTGSKICPINDADFLKMPDSPSSRMIRNTQEPLIPKERKICPR